MHENVKLGVHYLQYHSFIAMGVKTIQCIKYTSSQCAILYAKVKHQLHIVDVYTLHSGHSHIVLYILYVTNIID